MVHRKQYLRLALALFTSLLIASALWLPGGGWLRPARAAGMTITVINTRAAGVGSLRQAIMDSEGNAGVDTIRFVIGIGPQTITLATPLPTITDPVIIDGTTQPGFTSAPIIELNGVNLGGGSSGLLINAGSSTVKGLVINRFNTDGIRLFTKGG